MGGRGSMAHGCHPPHGESLLGWQAGGGRRQSQRLALLLLVRREQDSPCSLLLGWWGGEGGRIMSTSLSVRGAACERFGFGSGGLGRPLWGVVATGGWEAGAVGARSIIRTITIVFHVQHQHQSMPCLLYTSPSPRD
mgnify:FL=1